MCLSFINKYILTIVTILLVEQISIYTMTHKTEYNFVSSCTEYQNELDKGSEDGSGIFGEHCQSSDSKVHNYSNFDVTKTCPKVLGYLNEMDDSHGDDYGINGCKYLYYWIHYDAPNDKKNNDQTLGYYKALLDAYDYIGNKSI